MKAFETISRGTVKALPVFVFLILTSPAVADIFPVELLDEQATLTNVPGVPVAISGDYLAAGAFYSQNPTTVLQLENGQWLKQGSWILPSAAYESSSWGFWNSVALDGNTLVVGAPGAVGSGRAFVFTTSSRPGLNAWNIVDDSTASGVNYEYVYPLTSSQRRLATTNGWTLTIRSRMLDNFSSGGTNNPSCFVDYAIDPTNRFLIWFSLDANLNLVAQLNGLQTLTFTTNGDGWAAYHTHQIVFNPTNGTADYYFDGVKINSSPWSPTPVIPLSGIRFGNGSSAGEGGMNWNLVELKTQSGQVLASYDAGTAGNPPIAPDPTNQDWTLSQPTSMVGVTNTPVSLDFATVWPLQAVLAPSDGQSNDQFGFSVAIGSNTVVVGAPEKNHYEGSAYVYVRNGSNWTQQATLYTNSVATGDEFGYAVALNGGTAIVGAPQYDREAADGSAYVFVRSGTNWTPQQQLTANPQQANSFFGSSVAADGDLAAVGAPFLPGAVYVFGRTNGIWSQQDFPLPNNEPANSGFGSVLALKGDVVVAGGNYSNSYVFALGKDGWVQATNFEYATGSGIYGVAFDGQDVVVSEAPQEGATPGAVHVYLPDYSNPTAVANYVGEFLYYPDAESSLVFDPNHAAFRYKTLLYAQGTNGVLAQFSNMASLYGQAERDRADFAESELLKGLAFHPDDAGLGNLLLDIYYDRTEAEAIFDKNLLTQAEAEHFPTAISGVATPPSGFVIDNEIPLYEQALATHRYALEGYFSLFTNDLGIAGSPPLGYQIFTKLVPTRGLMPASYLDTNGVVQSVTSNNAALFNHYKDLTLLFGELQDYGETANTLGRLLLARGGPGDSMEASNTVGSSQQVLFLNGALLKSMFATLPGTNDPSGLAQSIAGWSGSLSALTTLQHSLIGGANLLGFAPDFLMYVYSLPGQSAGTFNSYDTLRAYLDPNNSNNGSHPLSQAVSALQTAEASYAAYRGYQDQLADQMTGLDQNYASRLRDIVGAYPGDSSYSDDPTNNPGSLLDQQYSIIEQGRLKILENQTDIANLNQRVQIEINRASSESNVYIMYGNKNASIDETIGNIQAEQAAANSAADTVNNVVQAITNPGAAVSAIVNLANGAVQADAEVRKGQLEAEKDQNAAMQQAQITGIDSAAAVKTMMLDMSTLLIESQETVLQLQQAVNQMAGLYREKQQLEQKIAQQNATLATRYYADPVHRLLAQSDMAAADLAFNEAQRWLFFMQRALAYKWNTPLSHAYNGVTWTTNTLFRLRNADELNAMFNAMNDWDSYLDATLAATETNVDYFSVRDDFFGYALSNSLGQALTYPDPITGQSVGPLQAFRDRLRQLQNTSDPNNSYLDLHFSTVRPIPGKSFFQGPVFAADGTVITRGLCLDKIQWIKINLPGPHTFGGSYLQGTLTYGGTSFIRNLDVGAYNTDQPDLLPNEMTAYSTRRWYFSPDQDTFTSEQAQSTSASMQLSTQAGVAPSSTEIDVFNEHSVATSGWELTIPTTVAGTPVMSIDQLNDIEIWFKHIATDRVTH